jgi:hypothetical protein
VAQAGLIDEKNWGSKISWHCPFKEGIFNGQFELKFCSMKLRISYESTCKTLYLLGVDDAIKIATLVPEKCCSSTGSATLRFCLVLILKAVLIVNEWRKVIGRQNTVTFEQETTGTDSGIVTVLKHLYRYRYGYFLKRISTHLFCFMPRYFEAETNPRIKHTKKGLVSMVNCGDNMLGSQFFFTLGSVTSPYFSVFYWFHLTNLSLCIGTGDNEKYRINTL